MKNQQALTGEKEYFSHFLLEYKDLTYELFKEKFISNIKSNYNYSILIRICSAEEQTFKMAGRQVGFLLSEENTQQLYHLILARVEMYSELYNLPTTIRSIDIMYKVVVPEPELALKNINSLKLDRRIVRIKETKGKFNFKLLPLTTDINYFGRQILTLEEKAKLQKFGLLNLDTGNSGFKLFVYTNSKEPEIIVLKQVNNIHYIKIYDYDKGFLIAEVTDLIISNNSLRRTINNVTLVIKNQEVQQIEISRTLNAISYKSLKMVDRNKNLGSFDLETFEGEEGIASVYALGFLTNYKPKDRERDLNLFYLTDEKFTPDDLILKCIDSMLKYKYDNFIFFSHNFGGYDFIFIYNILLKANQDKGFEYYKLTLSTREDRILKLTIKVSPDKGKPIKINFVDSLNLLNYSLDKLATSFFGGELQKGLFPYSFVKRNKLLYVGPTPDIKYYPTLNKDNPKHVEMYNNL